MASYAWSGPGGFSANTRCTGPIGVAGYYQVIITAVGGCADTCGRTLEVKPQPMCSITGENTIPEGSTTEFCATPGMVSYSWNGPFGFVDPGTQCTGQIGIVGWYTVTITDANGCTNTCSRQLKEEGEVSSMTKLGLVLFILTVAGFFGYMIFRRRRAA
jgi:hypothetical protein